MLTPLSVIPTATADPNEVLVSGEVDGVPTNVLLRDAANLKARYGKQADDALARLSAADTPTKLAQAKRDNSATRALIDADVFTAATVQHDTAQSRHATVKAAGLAHGERYAARVRAEDEFAAAQTKAERDRLAALAITIIQPLNANE